MSLRARISAAAGIAVGLAVLAAAVGVYLAVRSDLQGEIDQGLRQRAQAFTGPSRSDAHPPPAAEPYGDLFPGAPPQGGFPTHVQPAPFGAASGYVQFIAPNGTLDVPAGQGTSPRIAVSASDRAIAASGTGSALSDRTVKGTKLRVLTIGTGASGAVLIARPLSEMNHELSRILLLLVIVGVSGIALAAILGALVARVALAPIARFTKRTEALTGNLDLTRRLDVEGRDELARLAGSFNTTLDALERSVQEQRQLIADAGHELRTPIASLRANIQVLGEVERLPAAEQKDYLEAVGLAEPGLNRVIRAGYALLHLVTFFTAGPKEAKAWTVEQGARAPQAAGVIHTDFEKGFIRAETIAYDDYVAFNGEAGAREAGKFRLEGKDYVVADGDVLHFRFAT